MSDNNQNPSTVQSYVDSATGMAQRAVNTVTGSSNSEVRSRPGQAQRHMRRQILTKPANRLLGRR